MELFDFLIISVTTGIMGPDSRDWDRFETNWPRELDTIKQVIFPLFIVNLNAPPPPLFGTETWINARVYLGGQL